MAAAECFFAGRHIIGGRPPDYCWGPLQRCHLIPKQRIRKEYPEGAILVRLAGEDVWQAFDSRTSYEVIGGPLERRSLAVLQWDGRVWVPGCWGHHQQLDGGRLRLARGDLPAGVEEFALELGLVWSLDRDYGRVEAESLAPGGLERT